MTATFQLEGQEFTALNGGPQFTFMPAKLFVVHCETQEEVDELCNKLSEGGRKVDVAGSRTNTVLRGKSFQLR